MSSPFSTQVDAHIVEYTNIIEALKEEVVRLKQRLTAAGSAEKSGSSLATKAGGDGVSSLAQFQQRLDALLIRTLDDYEQLHDLRRQVSLSAANTTATAHAQQLTLLIAFRSSAFAHQGAGGTA